MSASATALDGVFSAELSSAGFVTRGSGGGGVKCQGASCAAAYRRQPRKIDETRGAKSAAFPAVSGRWHKGVARELSAVRMPVPVVCRSSALSYKRAGWAGLREALRLAPWGMLNGLPVGDATDVFYGDRGQGRRRGGGLGRRLPRPTEPTRLRPVTGPGGTTTTTTTSSTTCWRPPWGTKSRWWSWDADSRPGSTGSCARRCGRRRRLTGGWRRPGRSTNARQPLPRKGGYPLLFGGYIACFPTDSIQLSL